MPIPEKPSGQDEVIVDDFSDFIDEMPEVKEPEPEVETKPEVEKPEAETEEKPETEPEVEKPETETETETEINKFKLDDVDYTIDEIREFKKSHDNYENWRKTLTQKSQVAANLTEDQLQAVLTATDNLKRVDVPDDFNSPVSQIDFLKDDPFLVEVEDAEGLPAEVDLKPYLRPFIKQYEGKIKELQEKMGNYEAENNKIQQQNVLSEMRNNMSKFPKFAISDVSLETIDSILTAKNSHPEYDKLMAYKAVAQYAKETNLSFSKAYNKMYAKEIIEEKEAKRIKENAKKPPPESPSKPAPVDEVDKMYNDLWGEEDIVAKINALP